MGMERKDGKQGAFLLCSSPAGSGDREGVPVASYDGEMGTNKGGKKGRLAFARFCSVIDTPFPCSYTLHSASAET